MIAADFEVEISRAGPDGYRVAFRAPDGAEAEATLRLPADDELFRLLPRLPDAVLASSAQVRRAPTNDEQPVQRLGRLLYESVLAGDGRALLLGSRSWAAEQGRPLRLLLRVAPPELAALPWEFLYDPTQGRYLSLSTPLVRYPQIPQRVLPLRVVTPLRVLCMVVRAGAGPLDTERERERLAEALAPLADNGQVVLEFVAGETFRDLQSALRQPWHVFHFIGHGGFDLARRQGVLLLADDQDEQAPLGAEELADMFAPQQQLRLAVLNACETGRLAPDDTFSSVAGALTRQAVPAALGMQYPISDPAAIEFSRAFYDALTHGQPVDRAVTEARQSVRNAIPDTLEWGTPVLFLRARDGRLFDIVGSAADRESPVAGTGSEPSPADPEPAQSGPPADPEPTQPQPHPPAAAEPEQPTTARPESWLDPQQLRSFAPAAPVRGLHLAGELLRFAVGDSTGVAIADADGEVIHQLWENPKRSILSYPPAVAFSPDGTRLATGGDDRRLRVWSLPDGELLLDRSQKQKITAVAYSPDGTRLATGSYHRTVRVWDARTGALRLEFGTAGKSLVIGQVDYLAFSPTEDAIAAANNHGRVAVYHAGTGRRISGDLGVHWSSGAETPTALAYHPAGSHLAVGFFDGYGYVWRLSSEKWTVKFQHPGSRYSRAIHAAAFSHDGAVLATGGYDKHVRLWDLTTGDQLYAITHPETPSQLAFSADDRRLVIASSRQVQIWRLRKEPR